MTTINDVEFNMQDLEIIGEQRNVPSEQPGSDENFITGMGYNGLILRLTGFEKTLALYDSVISEFMGTGVQELSHRTGWQFSIYSTRFVPILSGGIVDNYFPYELILLTSTPYRESTTLSCRAKEITANNQEWSAGDTPCENILDNWSFEKYSGGFTSWSFSGTGSATQSATHKVGTYSAELVCSGGTYAYLQQTIPHVQYRDKQLTFGKWVKCATVGKVKLRIYDGTNAYSSANLTTDWEFLTVTKTIDGAAATILCGCMLDVGYTAYLDGAVLIEGASIPDYLADIDTDGSVDAIPDIQVTAGVGGTDIDINQSSQNGAIILTNSNNVGQTFIPAGNSLEKIVIYISSMVDAPITLIMRVFDSVAMTNELGSVTLADQSVGTKTFTFDPVIEIGDHDLMYFRLDSTNGVGKTASISKSNANPYTGGAAYLDDVIIAADDLKFVTYTEQSTTNDPVIYNTADPSVKCSVANIMLYESIHRINSDGTGTIKYSDDFSDRKYAYDSTSLNVTYDGTNNELDIADDGYIYWKCDAKYPITGIPTLTTQVDITSGIPTIQISADGTTWYDITTAIVDNVETVYELDSASLHIKEDGLTVVYWRIDCVKAAAATCSVKAVELDVDFVTIDVEHPKIPSDGVSTVRCDQDADSGMNCIIALFYRDRSWAV